MNDCNESPAHTPRRLLPEVQWLAQTHEHAVAELDIDAGLAAFDGHFASVPILPGVAQVEWAARLAAQVLPVPGPGRFLRIDGLKFLQVIRPDCKVRLELYWNPACHTLAFTLSSDTGRHATGRIVYRSADAKV